MKNSRLKQDVLRYKFTKKDVYLVTRAIRLPNGLEIKKDLILHPGAAMIIPFLNADKLIILRQYRSTLNKYLYEFPAGTIDPGEKPAACARREIMEEAGYRTAQLTKLGIIYPIPGYSDEVIHIFKAQKLRVQKKPADADEVIESMIVSRAQLKKLFKSGQIVDGKTIAGLAFCGLLS